MEFTNMHLKYRVACFAEIIANTQCTNSLKSSMDLEVGMDEVMNMLYHLREERGSLYILGNGGSAAVASHALIDFVNVARINAQVLHESSLLTCMSNDFGYENAYSRVLSQFIKPIDVLIAISSSGKSTNICNAVDVAKANKAKVITLSGFNEKNLLRSLGDINFWLDSCDYGYVEVGHQFILHNLSDRFGLENHYSTFEHITTAEANL